MNLDLVVCGNIVTTDDVIHQGWVGAAGATIVAIGSGHAPPARDMFDAGASFVFPGMVDGQTHAGSYRGLEGIRPTTSSAVAGGG